MTYIRQAFGSLDVRTEGQVSEETSDDIFEFVEMEFDTFRRDLLDDLHHNHPGVHFNLVLQVD